VEQPLLGKPRRVLLGAFGDLGHAFPMIALGRALAARGHDVTLQTWRRWQAHVEAEGLTFAPAPEYQVFPSGPEPLDFYEAVVHATTDTLPLLREVRPEVVVADILTLAPALAAELEGVPCATLIPHVYPHGERDFPIYSLGARLPRTAAGRWMWRHAQAPVSRGLERGRVELNETRARLGLPALAHVHGGISRELALVATFPQLEYPRRWPEHVHVVGPLMWEPAASDVELPPGTEPLVLVAPSPRIPSTACSRRHFVVWQTFPFGSSRHGTAACLPGLCRCPRTRASWSGSRTRARCPCATSSSATRATARSFAR
jgi:UDP:flavonoid glycosyltransferase YjiC (YdhE family)